jgi:hypothetical protein
MHEVVRDYRRESKRLFTATFGGYALPRREAWDTTNDAVCSDSLCRESVAWLWAFPSVDGRYRALGACFWGYFPHGGGGFANRRFPWTRGVAWWMGNLLPITVRVYPLFDLSSP